MMPTKYNSKSLTDLDEAEIDGYTDGFINKNKAVHKYIGKDILFSAYIKAKTQGSHDRVKVRNKQIKSRFMETGYE